MDKSTKNYVQIHLNEVDWILLKAMHKACYLDIVSFRELVHGSTVLTFVPDYSLLWPIQVVKHSRKNRYLKIKLLVHICKLKLHNYAWILIKLLFSENTYVLSLNAGNVKSVNHITPPIYNIKHSGFSHFNNNFMILPVPALGSVSKPILFDLQRNIIQSLKI